MRFREFATHLNEAEEIEAGPNEWSGLITVLNLMRRQGRSRGIPIKYNLEAFLRLVRNSAQNDSSLSTFSYDQLIKAREDSDVVKDLIDFNDKEVTIKVGGDEEGEAAGEKGGSEKTVSNMAKKALSKRT